MSLIRQPPFSTMTFYGEDCILHSTHLAAHCSPANLISRRLSSGYDASNNPSLTSCNSLASVGWWVDATILNLLVILSSQRKQIQNVNNG